MQALPEWGERSRVKELCDGVIGSLWETVLQVRMVFGLDGPQTVREFLMEASFLLRAISEPYEDGKGRNE
jgi:hypothetical protein